MNELLLLIEIIVIFSIVLLIKQLFGKEGLISWIAIASILANLEVAKSINLFGIDATLGNILFASNFLATDMLTEFYTSKDAKKGVKIGLIAIIVYLITTQFALLYKPNEIDIVNNSMKQLFSLNIRICISSIVMYYIANKIDIVLYQRLKDKFKDEKLWLRNNICTITCNCLENFGFNFLAFYKVFSISNIISISIATSIIEIIIAICDTPFLYLAKKNTKKHLKNKRKFTSRKEKQGNNTP